MTRKQIRFCEEYVVDWNATRAAKAAGYSEKTAYKIGAENLTKGEIKDYITEIQRDLSKLAGVSALRNIMELKKIAYSSIAHLHKTWIDLAEFETLTEDQKSCIESIETRIDTRTISEDETPINIEVKQVKLKLYSKQQAIEIMNKMLGYNEPDKIDHTHNIFMSDEFKTKTQARLSQADDSE